jgi:integrase
MGHVNTSMIYKTYGRYIPSLTRQDGSALEGLLGGTENEKGNPDRHNHGHNGQNYYPPACVRDLSANKKSGP